jgi:FAD/FMN-containing dehydrogenase/Fe-S oxidoreductase
MPGTDPGPGTSARPLLPLHAAAPPRLPVSAGAAAALAARLDGAIAGTVAFDGTTRAAYTTDASNYRRVPAGVVFPRSSDDIGLVVAACREMGVPVTVRGGGTSVAGNACGDGVVIDTSRHLSRIVGIDPDRALAVVEPGVVLDDLRRAAEPHGLTFGPDPSTRTRCTLGGMIGNNACGSHSVAWGRTADNVRSLDVLTADGTRLTVGPTDVDELARRRSAPGTEGRLYAGLVELLRRDAGVIREHLRPWARRVSGYSLEHLLPEHGTDVARALVGTEGTCAVVLRATVGLVPLPAARVLLVLGFEDDERAADATPHLLPAGPLTVEGIDRRLVELVRPSSRPAGLPPGGSWLLVEVGGDDVEDAASTAGSMAAAVEALGSLLVRDAAHQRAFWRLRDEGAGTLTRTTAGDEAWPGWEDAAVPPEHLGPYLRDFNRLQREHGIDGVTYGHFGEGCIHVRLDFDLVSSQGRQRFRTFIEEAADLVASYGGSLSGEHGDGQARSELLPRMYPPAVLETFRAFKALWDPGARLNPGIIVDPRPFDADLRLAAATSKLDADAVFSYPEDRGSFGRAVHRCVGVGKCRSLTGAAMCPSYQATGDELHSTRGRARLLQEMMVGDVVADGWASSEVLEALDLCLACKACASDCPVEVDMATYKAEFLHQHYAGRRRPASHYSMGWLPLWLRLGQAAPGLGNRLLSAPPVASSLKRLGGIARQRDLPSLPRRSLRSTFGARPRPTGRRTRGPLVLFPDTFTNLLAPHIGRAAVRALEGLGYEVLLPGGDVCCGLTWISTGQLGVARRVLARTVRVLGDAGDQAPPIIGLEPSCTSSLREELPRLVDGPAASGVAGRVRTLAELLDEELGDLDLPTFGGRAVHQPHCHQRAGAGTAADEHVLQRLGIEGVTIDPSCCGLAGNFGFEADHYEVAQAVGERTVLPAVRAAAADALVLADGYSCRTQIAHGTGRRALHLAEVLDAALAGAADTTRTGP